MATGELDAAVVCADTSETDAEVLRALLEVSRGGTTWPRLIGAADEASGEPERGEGALRDRENPELDIYRERDIRLRVGQAYY